MSVLTTLNGAAQIQVKWQPAAKQPTGVNYNPIANSTTLTKILTLGTNAVPSAINGADICVSLSNL